MTSDDAATRHDDAAAHIDALARDSYGRLLAILAARDSDIELAEEGLATAFAAAVVSWPRTGMPANPEAWLLTASRNHRHDILRSAAHRLNDGIDAVAERVPAPRIDIDFTDEIPDRRLALLFLCAHPEIDVAARTPLMLQTVLGIDAERIAHAFAVPASTMAQRLVRAKRRIRNARLPFEIPARAEYTVRLPAVLEAIYGAYAIDFPLVAGVEPRESLVGEALHLAGTLAALMPDEPEALGLSALLSLSIARRPDGEDDTEFVPLELQDATLWNRTLIMQGERHLHAARAFGRIGRFQLEAAIQSVHCARTTRGETDWHALLKLHAALLSLAPTLGALVAHAAALGRVVGPRAGLDALDAISGDAVRRFQPAWATRAHLLAAAGSVGAPDAYARAIALSTDERARRFLQRRMAELSAQQQMP